MDQLRKYLTHCLPWPTAEGPQSYVNIHWKSVGSDEKTYWSGRAVTTVDQAISTIKWALTLDNVRDIYLCQSAQSHAKEMESKAGNKYLLPIRNKETAVALKSLFIDLDVKGGEHGYEDILSAAKALNEFRLAVGLPRPSMLVGSGGGIHVYWVLDRALTRDEWQPLADALAEATRRLGLKCDTQCTVDSARILRPPQTLNWKTDPPRPTALLGVVVDEPYPVEVIADALQPFQVQRRAPSSDLVALPRREGHTQNQLGAGIQTKIPLDMQAIAAECAWVRKSLETGGVDNDNMLRRQAYLLSSFTENPRETAWEMVKNRDTLDDGEFDEQMDRVLHERETKNFGWPSCAAIRLAGCSDCATCLHYSKGKSPGNLALPQAPAAPVSDLPPGYRRNAKGLICVEVTTDLGVTHMLPVLDYDLRNPWLQKDPWILTFDAVLHDNIVSKIDVPYESTVSKDTLIKVLATAGITTTGLQQKAAQEFFVAWIKTLQARKNAVITACPFGWNMANGKIEGFVYGGSVWTAEGDRPAPNADPILQKQYQPVGDADCWRDASTLVLGRGRPELEAIVASAFGAPLMKFTGWAGSLLSAYSQESGIGKTTALKIAQAVWGDPVTAMQGLDDTSNSVLRKIGQTRALPLYWDEIKTEEDTKKFVRLAFSLSGGKEKSRLGRDTQLREVGRWQTMLVSATNDSLLDHIAVNTHGTNAGLYRIFEFIVAPPTKKSNIDVGDAQAMLSKLDDNFGMIGMQYAKWMGENYEQIELDIAAYRKSIIARIGLKDEERFWLAAIICTVMGARFATQLGVAQFDEKGIEDFLVETLESMRQRVSQSHNDLTKVDNLQTVLTQFLKAMHRHTLKTNKVCVRKGKPKKDEYKIIWPTDLNRLDSVHVQIGMEDKIIRLSSTALSDWLTARRMSRHHVMQQLKTQFNVDPAKMGRLGSGTSRVEGDEYLLTIRADGTPLAALIDDEDAS